MSDTTPKRNEAVAYLAGKWRETPVVTVEDFDGDKALMHATAEHMHWKPLYPQSVVDALQGEVSRLRAIADAARVYFDGYCQDEASDEVDGNGRGRWTGCHSHQIRDARALKEALNLEPPTDGR